MANRGFVSLVEGGARCLTCGQIGFNDMDVLHLTNCLYAATIPGAKFTNLVKHAQVLDKQPTRTVHVITWAWADKSAFGVVRVFVLKRDAEIALSMLRRHCDGKDFELVDVESQ